LIRHKDLERVKFIVTDCFLGNNEMMLCHLNTNERHNSEEIWIFSYVGGFP